MPSKTSTTNLVATKHVETGGQFDSLPQVLSDIGGPTATVSVTETIPQAWDNRYGTVQQKYFQTKVMRTDGCAGDTQNSIAEYLQENTTVPDQPRL